MGSRQEDWMHWLADTFQKYPEIAIYLALGIGFWFGKLKFGSFSLGTGPESGRRWTTRSC